MALNCPPSYTALSSNSEKVPVISAWLRDVIKGYRHVAAAGDPIAHQVMNTLVDSSGRKLFVKAIKSILKSSGVT